MRCACGLLGLVRTVRLARAPARINSEQVDGRVHNSFRHMALCRKRTILRMPPTSRPIIPLRQSTFTTKVLQKHLLVTPPQEILDILSTTNEDDVDEPLLIWNVSRWINDYILNQMSSTTSEAAYTEKTLSDYDTIVWDFNSPYHWRIHALDIQTLYDTCLAKSVRHCEVAVGTGLFLKGLQAPDKKSSLELAYVTLMDLNPNSLKLCQNRLRTETDYYSKNNVKMDLVVEDILNPDFCSSSLIGMSYDSVAANFLLHCLHRHDSRVETLRLAIQNIASLLKPETGVFFGSTILGKELLDDEDTAVGPAAIETLRLYNKFGVFGNEEDSFELLSKVFNEIFDEVEIWQVGYCAVWKAKWPIDYGEIRKINVQ